MSDGRGNSGERSWNNLWNVLAFLAAQSAAIKFSILAQLSSRVTDKALMSIRWC